MPKILNKDLADLTHQLTRSPRRMRVDQLRAIELLLELVEPEKVYPFDFVCFHITGYRKRRNEAGPAIPGKALICDLVTMAESLSRKANLAATELDEPFLTHQEVADQLNVSTKTIRRWRNRGLVGFRVVFEDGVNRLAFCKSTVERFSVRHRDLVEKGAAFKQLTTDEKDGIVQRARELVDRRPMKLHAAAKKIAAETGRAVETVRYTLRRHDESSDAPVFVGLEENLIPDRFQAIWQCHERGEGLDEIASAFDCDRSDIEQALRYTQLALWKQAGVDFIPNELFDAPEAHSIILDAPEVQCETPEMPKVPKDTPAYLRELYRTPLLSREQEQDLFRRYNYLKYLAKRALDAIDLDEFECSAYDEIGALMSRVESLKKRLTKANLRLVVSIAKKHVGWSPNFFEVVSDGNVSLMRAVEKFDFARGVKFSTYASWAIMKNFARTVPEQRYHAARYVTGQEELLDAAADYRRAPNPAGDRKHMREAIAKGLESLTDREREILSSHFGLGGDGAALTLDQLGQRFGVTKERVRQIEKRALARLKEVLAPSLADMLPA